MKKAALACLIAILPLAAAAQLVSARDVTGQISGIHSLVSQIALETGVPDRVAHALVSRESGYNWRAVGRAGEIGLTQIKPATARAIGFRGTLAALFDPATNLRFGLRYARMALDRGNIRLYQTGIGR